MFILNEWQAINAAEVSTAVVTCLTFKYNVFTFKLIMGIKFLWLLVLNLLGGALGKDDPVSNPKDIDPNFECAWREFAYQYGQYLQPWQGTFQSLFDALQLETVCNQTMKTMYSYVPDESEFISRSLERYHIIMITERVAILIHILWILYTVRTRCILDFKLKKGYLISCYIFEISILNR